MKPSEQLYDYLHAVAESLAAHYAATFSERGLREPSDEFGKISFFLSKDGKITDARIAKSCTKEADDNILLAIKALEKNGRIQKMPEFFDKAGIELSFIYGPIVRLKDLDPFTGSYADRFRFLDNTVPTASGIDCTKEAETKPKNPQQDVSNSPTPIVDRKNPPWPEPLDPAKLEVEHLQRLEEGRKYQEEFLRKLFTGFDEVSLFFDRSVHANEKDVNLYTAFLQKQGIQVVQKSQLGKNNRLLKLRAVVDGPDQYTVRLLFGDSRILSPELFQGSEVEKAFGYSVEWSKYFDHPPRSRKERESFFLTALQDFVDRVNVTRQTGTCPPM